MIGIRNVNELKVITNATNNLKYIKNQVDKRNIMKIKEIQTFTFHTTCHVKRTYY